MLLTNPFSILAISVSPIFMQAFVIIMAILTVVGTLLDIVHKKNIKYFFNNAKKAKLSATKTLSTGEKISVISKTIVSDIATTSELGAGKRRAAHLLGMYGTILFWIASVIMIFCYATPSRYTICMANHLACRCHNDSSRRILVLVFSKSRCLFRSSTLVQNY